MPMISATAKAKDLEGLADEALVEMARHRDEPAIRCLVQRHNQRVFRTARSILGSDSDAEDVVQATYLSAFGHLDTFRGESLFSTWLTRIAVNEALARLRRRRPTGPLEEIDAAVAEGRVVLFPTTQQPNDPEVEMSRVQVRAVLERAIDSLPLVFRPVLVLRDIEGLSVEETASQLALRPETVRTRLHRARKMLRRSIEKEISGSFSALFPFDGERCVHMADRVIAALGRTERS
jgi:RNA polymerase sigma-70 factor (ECF subfamily)